MGRIRIAGAILAVSALACGDAAFDSAANDGGGNDASTGDASGDASPGDAVANDSGDDSGDVPGNLLMDPGFEGNGSGTAGCGPYWVATYATLSLSTIARHGSASCMVCSTEGQSGAVETNSSAAGAGLTNPEAGLYQATAWVMPITLDGGATPSAACLQFYEPFADGGGIDLFGSPVDFAVPPPAWSQVYLAANLGPGGTLTLGVFSLPAGTGCMLVDDVALVVQ